MFNKVGVFLAKKVLPIIVANLIWEPEVIHKEDGVYFRLSLEAFGIRFFKNEWLVYRKDPDKKVDLPELPGDFNLGATREGASLEALRNSAMDEIREKSKNFLDIANPHQL